MKETPDQLADRAELLGAPSANGELVFEQPWEGRVLSMAVCLSDSGELGWERFRTRLVGEIGKDAHSAYYVQFLNALQEALVGEGLLAQDEISNRVKLLADTPHEHA